MLSRLRPAANIERLTTCFCSLPCNVNASEWRSPGRMDGARIARNFDVGQASLLSQDRATLESANQFEIIHPEISRGRRIGGR